MLVVVEFCHTGPIFDCESVIATGLSVNRIIGSPPRSSAVAQCIVQLFAVLAACPSLVRCNRLNAPVKLKHICLLIMEASLPPVRPFEASETGPE